MILNTYKTFWNPKLAFEDVFLELKKAKKSIYIETFMFESDSIGSKILSILKDKSKNIPVTLSVDGYGLQKLSSYHKRLINNSKIKFIIFNPLWYNIKKFRIHRWFRSLPYRNHRKLILIDDKVSFVGGLNLHSEELKWHDLLVKIHGPIVSQLSLASKEMLDIMNKPKTSLRTININNTLIFEKNDCITRQIPLSFHKPLKKQLKRLINLAKKEICISTPYFIPDPHFHNLLRLAVKRGILVKLLVPEKSDRPLADSLARMNLFFAYKEGVHIHLFPKMTHAKFILVDKKVCSFGSANMDYQSFYNNYELNITSNNKSLTTSISNEFKTNWSKSKPFNPKIWTNRNPLKKFKARVLHIFRRYF